MWEMKGAICLFDEPVSYLHASAQGGAILKSKRNIKYKYCNLPVCTPQYLFSSKNFANINNNIRITVKENGLISLQNFAEYPKQIIKVPYHLYNDALQPKCL